MQQAPSIFTLLHPITAPQPAEAGRSNNVAQPTLDIVNAAAQAVSALGTLAAVIVALYLARHQVRANLAIRTTVVRLVTPGVPDSDEGRFLRVGIANSGFRDVKIISMGWQVGRIIRRAHFHQLLPLNALSSSLPAKLAPGDTADFYYPWEQFIKNSTSIRTAIGTGWLRRRRARTTQFVAYLSTGEAIRSAIERQLSDEFLRLMEDQSNAG